MNKWILRCLVFRKTIITMAIIFLALCSFGISYLDFDFKLDVMNRGKFSQETTFVTMYDQHLFDREHLKKLGEIQKQLSKIGKIEKIMSLYTLPNIRRYLDEKKWYPVLENKNYTEQELRESKSDVLDNNLLLGKFINKSADTMIFYLYLPTDKYGSSDLQIRDAVQRVLTHYQSDFSRIFQSGVSEIVYVLAEKTKLDLLICMPVLFVIMSLLFGWLFRSLLISLFPVVIAAFGIVCALGIMGWLGIPISALFIVAIVLSLAITVASNAHIIHAYQESINKFSHLPFQDHISFVMKKMLLPFLLAVFCALLGFLLDILSFVRIIQDLSYAFAFCIICNTFSTIFISPLMLSMFNVKYTKERKIFSSTKEFLLKANDFLVLFPKYVTTFLLIICVVGFCCTINMTIESLPYVLFKNDEALIKDTVFSSKQVSGQNVLQINISANKENAFLEPVFLKQILNVEKKILSIDGTSHTYSIADVIATINQIFMFNTKKFFSIPENSAMLKLFYDELSGQEFMGLLINHDFNSISLYINYNLYSSEQVEKYKRKIDEQLKSALKGTSLHVEVIDYWSEYASIIHNLILLQIFSILTIYLLCFVVVGVLFRSFIAGMISVIPNVFPLCVIAIAQYLLNIPITLVSVILYSIVVGLSVDETMHMFYSFKQEYLTIHDRQLAAKAALRSQAMPVTVSTASIALACLVLLGSQFYPVKQLGLLTEVGSFATWIADLMISPFLFRKIMITKQLELKKKSLLFLR